MKFISMLAMEIFLQHQLAVPRDQKAVVLRRVRRIHRLIEDGLDEFLSGSAIDVGFFERSYGPAVIITLWRSIGITARIFPPRIKVALIAFAMEVIGAAAIGEGEGDDLTLRI